MLSPTSGVPGGGESDGGAGQVGAAAADQGHVLPCGVLNRIRVDGAVAAHHQVNAGGLGRKVRRHIPVGVADHHHQVAVLPLQLFLPVLRPLPDVAVLRVVPVGKVHALAVGGGSRSAPSMAPKPSTPTRTARPPTSAVRTA